MFALIKITELKCWVRYEIYKLEDPEKLSNK
jgi:hypothetical protein